jgi:hypothetical protein
MVLVDQRGHSRVGKHFAAIVEMLLNAIDLRAVHRTVRPYRQKVCPYYWPLGHT